ncbi:hypothetical protein [Nostoc sp.]|uniref:hypothetical protein n=1 Tax=Nostoc sp. TaxID=1180 RepID=UPI002FF677E6
MFFTFLEFIVENLQTAATNKFERRLSRQQTSGILKLFFFNAAMPGLGYNWIKGLRLRMVMHYASTGMTIYYQKSERRHDLTYPKKLATHPHYAENEGSRLNRHLQKLNMRYPEPL